ncbi:hypothetical protein QEN19_003794 [Hanseniaspora menglaensis]
MQQISPIQPDDFLFRAKNFRGPINEVNIFFGTELTVSGKYVCPDSKKIYIDGVWIGSETAVRDLFALDYPNKPARKKCLATFFKTPDCIKIYPLASNGHVDSSKKPKDAFDSRIRRAKDSSPPVYCFKCKNLCFKLRSIVLSLDDCQSNHVYNQLSETVNHKILNESFQTYVKQDIHKKLKKNKYASSLINKRHNKFLVECSLNGNESETLSYELNDNSQSPFKSSDNELIEIKSFYLEISKKLEVIANDLKKVKKRLKENKFKKL